MAITRDYDDVQLNKIKEIVDVGNAAAADSLKKIIGQNVAILADKANGIYFNQLDVSDILPCIAINISTSGAVHGKCSILASVNNVNKIINVLMNIDSEEADLLADEIRASALTELFNQLIAVFTRTISSLWNEEITFVQTDVNMYDVGKALDDICGFNSDEEFVYLTNMLSVQGMSSSTVYMLFDNELAHSYLKKLCGGYEEESIAAESITAESVTEEPVAEQKSNYENYDTALQDTSDNEFSENRQMSQSDIEDLFASLAGAAGVKENMQPQPDAAADKSQDYENNNADRYNEKPVLQPVNNLTETCFQSDDKSFSLQKNETPYSTKKYINYKQETRKSKERLVNVKEAQFPSFDDSENTPVNNAGNSNIDVLMDVPLDVRVKIGKAKKTMSEIMKFTQGTIIILEKQAGAPVDVIANNQIIAHGDIIVVDDNFGVRITEIVNKKKNNFSKK